MPGRQTGDNKFGLTPFIVGQVLGDGCNYTSIQTAIDDCFAAGGGVVGIRPSTTSYVENLTLRSGVDLYGFCVDGRLPSFIGSVVIEGNHTFTQGAGFGAVLAQYITFLATAGDAFTMVATGGGSAIIAVKFVGVEANSLAGQRGCVFNPDAASSCQFSTDNTNIQSDSHCFENVGLGSGSAFLSLGSVNSSTGDILNVSAGGSGSVNGQYAQVSAQGVLNSVAGNGSANFTFSEMFSSNEAFLFGVAGGNVQAIHCTIGSNAVSGNWVDGLVGTTVLFSDVSFQGSAQNIGAAVSQNKLNWQPYAETSAIALASNRGTSSYDVQDFVVTDGFVQIANSSSGPITQVDGNTGSATPVSGILNIIGLAGVTTTASGSTLTIDSVVWSDVAAPTLLTVNSGSFDVVGTTLTLPALPIQGQEVRIYSHTSPTVVQANAGQQIQLATSFSSVAGTATGTNVGDALTLTFHALGNCWRTQCSMGIWVLA